MKAKGTNATARSGADAQQAAVLASWLPPPIPSCMSLLRSTKTFLPALPPNGADALAGCDNDQLVRRDKGRTSGCREGGGKRDGKAGSSTKRNSSSTTIPSSALLPPSSCRPLPNHSSSTSTSSSSSTSSSTPFLMDPARLRALGIDRQMLVDIGLENEETRSNPLYLQMAHQLRRGARKKDPNAPKRPLSAYNIFFRDMKEGLTTAGPTVKKTFEGLGKYVGEEWRKLGEEEKGRYERMAEVERKRYHSEMAAYEGGEEVMVKGEEWGEGQRRGLSVVPGGGQGGGGGGVKRPRGQATTKKVTKRKMDSIESGKEGHYMHQEAGRTGSETHPPPVPYPSSTGFSASFSTIKSSSSSTYGSNSSSNSSNSSSGGSSSSGSRSSSLAHLPPSFPSSSSSHPPLWGTAHPQIQPLQQLKEQQQSQLEEGQQAGASRIVTAPQNHSRTSISSTSSTSISCSSDDILPGGPPNFSFSLPSSPAMPYVPSGTTSRGWRGGGGGGTPMDVVAHQPVAPLPPSTSLPSASNSVEEKIRRQIAALQTKALLKQQRMQQQLQG